MLHNTLFQVQEFKNTPSAPAALWSSCLRHLPHPPPFKILDPPHHWLLQRVGCSTDIGSISWKTTWRGSCDSDLCSGWCLVRLRAQRTPVVLGAQSDRLQKSMASPVVELAEMEGGQSVIGLLIIDSSWTLQPFSRRLAYSPVSHFT